MSEMNLKQKITFVALFQVTYTLFQVHVTLQRWLNNSGMVINSKVLKVWGKSALVVQKNTCYIHLQYKSK